MLWDQAPTTWAHACSAHCSHGMTELRAMCTPSLPRARIAAPLTQLRSTRGSCAGEPGREGGDTAVWFPQRAPPPPLSITSMQR